MSSVILRHGGLIRTSFWRVSEIDMNGVKIREREFEDWRLGRNAFEDEKPNESETWRHLFHGIVLEKVIIYKECSFDEIDESQEIETKILRMKGSKSALERGGYLYEETKELHELFFAGLDKIDPKFKNGLDPENWPEHLNHLRYIL